MNVLRRSGQTNTPARFQLHACTGRWTRISIVAFILGFALTLYACSSVSTSTTKAQRADPASFRLAPALEERSNALVSLRTEGNLSVEVEGKTQRAQFVSSLYKKDSLVLTVLGPFNILAAKIGSTSDFMNYYDALANTVYQGAPSPKNFQQRLGVPLSHTDIASFLRGEIPGGFAGFTLEAANSGDTSQHTYVRQQDTTTEQVTYSFVENAVTTYKRSSQQSGTIIDAQYSNFTTSENIRLPQDAVVLFPPAKAVFTVQCRVMEANPKNQIYTFLPPLEAKRRKF
jgi:Domain of unknown function (DUF4292)